jgi:hypothetical protein
MKFSNCLFFGYHLKKLERLLEWLIGTRTFFLFSVFLVYWDFGVAEMVKMVWAGIDGHGHWVSVQQNEMRYEFLKEYHDSSTSSKCGSEQLPEVYYYF